MSHEPAQSRQVATPVASKEPGQPAGETVTEGAGEEKTMVEAPVPDAPEPPTLPGNQTGARADAAAQSISTQLGIKVPSILLEDDEPATAVPVGLGPKHPLAQVPGDQGNREQPKALPGESDAGRLLLTARDPHALYLHWEGTLSAKTEPTTAPVPPELRVRLLKTESTGSEVVEVPVPAERRHWFIYAPDAATSYRAELGFYGADARWRSYGTSNLTRTPPDSAAKQKEVVFATFPLDLPLSQAVSSLEEPAAVKASEKRAGLPAISPPPPLLPFSVLNRSERSAGFDAGRSTAMVASPAAESEPAASQGEDVLGWTAEQERQLTELIGWVQFSGNWAGSAQIPELLYGSRPAIPAQAGLSLDQPREELPPLLQPISSPAGGERPAHEGFWLNVNAELVVYGATEPNARVTLGGEAIQLRPDGTFSLRFSLPDGRYELPIRANSPGGELRAITLSFQRATASQGEVGVCPPDPSLKQPGGPTKA